MAAGRSLQETLLQQLQGGSLESVCSARELPSRAHLALLQQLPQLQETLQLLQQKQKTQQIPNPAGLCPLSLFEPLAKTQHIRES